MTDFLKKSELVSAILCNEYDKDFFTSGGCGVFAALLAEVAARDGQHGEFNLVMREDIDGDQWLSHITYYHYESSLDLDVGGRDAEDRWMAKISEEVEEDGEDPSELVFDNIGVAVGPEDDIMKILLDTTEQYGLNVGQDWVQEHYPRLRERVLKSVHRAFSLEDGFTPN